jgi:gluconolactonase
MNRQPHWNVLASNLGFPEGPLALADGSVLVCDVHGGLVRRVVDGQSSVLADLGGAPNGLALGPDGWLYVANNGGAMRWKQQDGLLISEGFLETGFDARIERIDLETGRTERVLDKVDGRALQAIDDLVFGSDGGFWFTDLGRDGERGRSYGGVYWSSLDGKDRREAAYPLAAGANGIGLSPDGRTLYATEYAAGRLWAWSVDGPGRLRHDADHAHGGRLIWQAPDALLLDSLAITAAGNVVIATQPSGVFSVISPEGVLLSTIETPEHFPTNLCFDPTDPHIAYATFSNTGCLARVEWDEPGLIDTHLLLAATTGAST